jgi:hypothetical protein
MERSVTTKAETFICEQLASGPKRLVDLVKVGDFSIRTLQRAGQNLGVSRSRSGRRGSWIWSLTGEPEYLPPPVAEAEPPAQAPEAAPENAYTVDDLLALAVEGGLRWPLVVTIKNPAPVDVAHKWSTRVFSSRGVVQEIISNDFIPDDAVVYDYITIRESQPPGRVGGIFAPGPWSLVLEHGQLSWRDWRYRRPKPSARVGRCKET